MKKEEAKEIGLEISSIEEKINQITEIRISKGIKYRYIAYLLFSFGGFILLCMFSIAISTVPDFIKWILMESIGYIALVVGAISSFLGLLLTIPSNSLFSMHHRDKRIIELHKQQRTLNISLQEEDTKVKLPRVNEICLSDEIGELMTLKNEIISLEDRYLIQQIKTKSFDKKYSRRIKANAHSVILIFILIPCNAYLHLGPKYLPEVIFQAFGPMISLVSFLSILFWILGLIAPGDPLYKTKSYKKYRLIYNKIQAREKTTYSLYRKLRRELRQKYEDLYISKLSYGLSLDQKKMLDFGMKRHQIGTLYVGMPYKSKIDTWHDAIF